MDSGIDDDKNPIWTCRNCYKSIPKKSYNTKKKAQRAKDKPRLDKIFNDLLKAK
jgi:ribosomal protein L37AE/L43A